jgi:hypothetical protein
VTVDAEQPTVDPTVGVTLSVEALNAEEEPTSGVTTSDATHSLVQGNGFAVPGSGQGYSVGYRFKIGEGVDGWNTPAVLEVSAVGGGGAITEVTLIEGGAFSGDAGPGTYNLDENSAALLLKAKSSSATPTARGVHQQSQAQAQSTANGLIFGMCIAAFFVVVAMFVVRRRSAATPAPAGITEAEASITTTPSSDML